MASSSSQGSPERLPPNHGSAPNKTEEISNEKQDKLTSEQAASMPQSAPQKTGVSTEQLGELKSGQSTLQPLAIKSTENESVQTQRPTEKKEQGSKTTVTRTLSPDWSDTAFTDGGLKVRKSIMKSPSPEPQKRDSGCSLSSDTEGNEEMGSPSYHRRVSFADEKGLDLDDCHEFPDNLEFDYLQSLWQTTETQYKITPLFEQPFCDFKNFTAKLEKQNICLENIASEETRIYGSIRVRNIAYEKIVFVRATFDQWQSCRDYFANYATSIGRQDVFSFEIDIKAENLPEDRESIIKFCICFEVNHMQYWDSNDEQNYELMITPMKRGSEEDPDSALESDNENKSNGDNGNELELEEYKSVIWSEIKKKIDLAEKKNYSESEKKAKDDSKS